MKCILVYICVRLYRIKNEKLRYILRIIIASLDGGYAFSGNLRNIMNKYYGIKIGIGTYGPCFNPQQAFVGYGNLEVGKFTSIAQGVCFYTRNHPYWFPSTSPLFYNSNFVGGVLENDEVPFSKLSIGNDVWIGQYAVILPSCNRIGDGAVIGAGAIVTHDVPDYAVAFGNPAKVAKYRFSEDQIAILKKIKWWDWDINFIKAHAAEFKDYDKIVSLSDTLENYEILDYKSHIH